MNRLGVAALAALGVAVLAGAGAAAVPAMTVASGPARPAESGARDSAATTGPLAIGAVVSDFDGVQVGHIARMTTDRQGNAVVDVRQGETVFTIPIDDLMASDGVTYTSLTLEQLKHTRQAP